MIIQTEQEWEDFRKSHNANPQNINFQIPSWPAPEEFPCFAKYLCYEPRSCGPDEAIYCFFTVDEAKELLGISE